MGRSLVLFFFFTFFSIFISLSVAADWNILNFGFGGGGGPTRGESLRKYCESWRMNVEMNNVRWFEAVPQECASHIEKYMTSEQYEADSIKALDEVRLYLATCCCGSNPDGKDAWIFDIDDTLLSTIPYHKKHGFGEKLNATSMEIWMTKIEAPALKPTLKIFKEIKDQGIKIFLISSRRECIRSETVDNLLDVGYHGWATLYLRSPKDELVEVNKYKAGVRQQLVDGGYRLKGIIGDHWSSFEGYPSANRAYKLPNSIYYV